jgi:serine/threonine protein kinase
MPAQAANILVGEDGQVRLADFGVACALSDDGEAPTLHGLQMKPRPAARSTPIGTPVFMAPEVSY